MTLQTPARPVRDPGSLPARLTAVLRGLWAVLRFLAGTVAAFTAAAIGLRPGITRTLCRLIADEYRRGRAGAVDADVVDDGEVGE